MFNRYPFFMSTSQNSPFMLRKEDKENIKKPEFIDPSQIAQEMDELMKYYNIDKSIADLNKTRRILSGDKVSSFNKELEDMREENISEN
jgi:hypothetical protein